MFVLGMLTLGSIKFDLLVEPLVAISGTATFCLALHFLIHFSVSEVHNKSVKIS